MLGSNKKTGQYGYCCGCLFLYSGMHTDMQLLTLNATNVVFYIVLINLSLLAEF